MQYRLPTETLQPFLTVNPRLAIVPRRKIDELPSANSTHFNEPVFGARTIFTSGNFWHAYAKKSSRQMDTSIVDLTTAEKPVAAPSGHATG
jgi:hypothetical protein